MAGRFLSIEEAAQRLGVSVDEVNRLVDRKKLFPMRDGTTLKFKADEVERVAGQLGEESSRFDDLSLDIDSSGSAAGSGPAAPALSGIEVGDIVLEDIALDDQQDAGSIFADEPAAASPSQTGAPIDVAGSGIGSLSGLSVAGLGGVSNASAADVLFDDEASADSEELSLESIVGASSPSLVGRSLPADAGTMAVDLGSAVLDAGDLSGGSLVVGSTAGLATGSGATGAGAALSGVLDSGLSLEDADVALSGLGASGLDLGAGSGIEGGAADGATMLGGDDFELGGLGGDDESASVVIAAEESTESSFFGETMAGAGSSFADDSAAPSLASSAELTEYPHELAFDIRFSVWQICGLVCCALMLLMGGFVALDLVRTIGSPAGTVLANPLLNAMSDAFGWR